MESKSIIEYKWKSGVYDLKYMVQLVRNGVINKDQFFYITRYNFDGVVENRNY